MTGALNRQLVDAVAEAVRDDADARRLLLEALGLGDAPPDELGRPVAFTAATLADVLDVTPKVVLGAIGRGELAATRSGRRYVISADAVEGWLSGRRPRSFGGGSRTGGQGSRQDP